MGGTVIVQQHIFASRETKLRSYEAMAIFSETGFDLAGADCIGSILVLCRKISHQKTVEGYLHCFCLLGHRNHLYREATVLWKRSVLMMPTSNFLFAPFLKVNSLYNFT